MDRITEIETFVAIVDKGGFTEAAKFLGQSKSSVSKHLSSLESRLGASLLNRTTRNVSTTDLGDAFYTRCIKLLHDWEAAAGMVSAQQAKPQGLLRVSVGTDFGRAQMSDCFPEFLAEFPEISIEAMYDNRFVDLLTERVDLAVRIGDMEDSNLRARKLAVTQFAVLGAPSYLEKHGTPEEVDDLQTHALLHYTNQRGGGLWGMGEIFGEARGVVTETRLTVNDGKALAEAAISGCGLAYLPCFLYSDAVRNGKLKKVLTHLPKQSVGIYAVYQPNEFVQPKLRSFIDFLVAYFKGFGEEDWQIGGSKQSK